MRILRCSLVFALLAVVTIAPVRADDKQGVVVSLQFNVPLANPLSLTTDPTILAANAGGSMTNIHQWFDLVESWWATSSSPYGAMLSPGSIHPYGDSRGRASRNFRPDVAVDNTHFIQGSRSAEAYNEGLPLGFSLDFRFERNLLLTVGYQHSRTTVLTVHSRDDSIRVDDVGRYYRNLWDVYFDRTIRDRDVEHKLRSHYISAALAYDVLVTRSKYFTLAPVIGGQLWLTRNRVHTSGIDYTLVPTIPEIYGRELTDGARAHDIQSTTRSFYESRYQGFVGIHARLRTPERKDHYNPGAYLALDVRRIILGSREVTFTGGGGALGEYPINLNTSTWQATASFGLVF